MATAYAKVEHQLVAGNVKADGTATPDAGF